jgi:hypothetical protein
MSIIKELHPQFVTDKNGKKTGVILPIYEYDELLEDLDDLAVAAERRDESTISHDALRTELKQNGILQD